MVAILFSAMTVFPIAGLLNFFRLPDDVKTFSLILYLTSPSIIIFPALDPVSLIILFSTLSVYLYFKSVFEGGFWNFIGLGLSMATLTFFSFISVILISFLAIHSGIEMLR